MKKTGLLLAGLAMVFTSCTNESLNGNENTEALKEISKSSNVQLSLNDAEVSIIDFDGFSAGDLVTSVAINTTDGCEGSVSIWSYSPDRFPGQNVAMIFDSSNPTGGDFDLGTPNEMFGGPGISSDGDQPSNDTALGNVLINSRDLDQSDPDDSYLPGTYHEIDFSGVGDGYVTLHSFDMLDLDAPGKDDLLTTVTLYGALDNILFQMQVPYGDDNAKQLIDLGPTEGVVRMVLDLNNSGAIDNIMFSCMEREIEIGACETMFAKGDDDVATCFIDDDYGFNRWGWTNGPLSTGEYTFDVYAGAGQCDTDKGALAGTVTLDYNSETGDAYVTYSTNDDFVLTETHLYVGNTPYPMKKKGKNGYVPTVAPGQFPYQHGDLDNENEDSYMINGLSGDIYMIAHGVVCEVIEVEQGGS